MNGPELVTSAHIFGVPHSKFCLVEKRRIVNGLIFPTRATDRLNLVITFSALALWFSRSFGFDNADE